MGLSLLVGGRTVSGWGSIGIIFIDIYIMFNWYNLHRRPYSYFSLLHFLPILNTQNFNLNHLLATSPFKISPLTLFSLLTSQHLYTLLFTLLTHNLSHLHTSLPLLPSENVIDEFLSTRLDLPFCLWTLQSLRILNLWIRRLVV